MCGIAGILKAGLLSPADTQRDLPRMARALQHRGPDDEGLWHDAEAGVALCHRRLSIIDLSPLGHQPMSSASQRFVVVYNGEIYNYLEMRRELVARGCAFRGTSDTEVLLAAIEAWGIASAIERSHGMFALAVWDRQERALHLARDRFGEKPLYFGVLGNTLLFGSELKALREHATWSDEIDRDALALLMQHDFVPAPYSIFKNIRKVMPGSIVTVRASGGRFQVQEQRYWRPEELFDRAADAAVLRPEEYIERVDAALTRAVERQMLADVPLGAFLSGGTDSSLVVAYMQKASTQRVKTFSIGFEEREYDESPFAREVASRLGTEHTELIVSGRDCLQVVPKLPDIYDEPFADSSQIPTYLVCSLARRSVTVALSGDGGDELFAGYGRYAVALSKWRTLQKLPAAFRNSGSALVETLSPRALHLAAQPAALIWGRHRSEALVERLHNRSSRWRARTAREFYRAGLRRWHVRHTPVLGASAQRADDRFPRKADDLKQLMHFDICEYLPDDILVKVDRAAMAVSLETRVPLLDVEVALAAWSIPSAVLRKDGRGKWVLRQLLQRHVPLELIDRPKKGFAVPLAKWLRGELRPWAAELLDPYRVRQEGYLDSVLVQRRWQQHLSGRANWAPQLWNILTFQAWLERWRSERTMPELQARTG